MNETILLVEDNEKILRGNENMLRLERYEVMTALSLSEAQTRLSEKRPDVIVLDIMLPDGSGLDFLSHLRKRSNIPVLLLTGLGTNNDITKGLRAGGDDYLVKPYDFDVLLARIEALLRRASQAVKTVSKGSLILDIVSNRAYLRNEDLVLSQKEFAVLLLLSENTGNGVSAEHIYESVWKQTYTTDNTSLKNVISRLRKKLEGYYAISNDRLDNVYVLERLPQ